MSRCERGARFLVGAALLVAYGIALIHHTSYVAGGSDSSGYLNAARLFARGHVTEPIRGLVRLGLPGDFARVFVPLGYVPLGERAVRMAPSYPPGLPLQMALAAVVGGWSWAPFLVIPLSALACLVLIYLVGRELGLSRPYAFAGSCVLAFFPTFVFGALQPMSDVLATAWALFAVLAAYRSRARNGAVWAALAGFAFGMGILVRPTNALLLAALVIVLPLRPKTLLSFVTGGIPPAIFLLAYDSALFGSPWSTGYQSLLSGGLAWSNFPERARYYTGWIARLLTPLVPIGWLAVASDRRAPVRDRAVLISWFAGFFLFYSCYVVYDAWWYTRFLLPSIPAMILGALVVARDLSLPAAGSSRHQWARVALVLLLVFVVFTGARFIDRNRVHKFYKGERIYPRACAMARRRVPANSLVVSMQMSGALHYYTDLTYGMWNWLTPERFTTLRESTESRGRRWYALLAPFEQPEARKNLPGEWREIDRVDDVALWELPPAKAR
jgi:Dolichyl-phosphate-mannose-protein mannosyltransferase